MQQGAGQERAGAVAGRLGVATATVQAGARLTRPPLSRTVERFTESLSAVTGLQVTTKNQLKFKTYLEMYFKLTAGFAAGSVCIPASAAPGRPAGQAGPGEGGRSGVEQAGPGPPHPHAGRY